MLFDLVLPTAGVLNRARELHEDQQVAFWDAVLYGTCLETGVMRLYSEDVPGRPISGLEIINPFA